MILIPRAIDNAVQGQALFQKGLIAILVLLCMASAFSAQARAETVNLTVSPNSVTLQMHVLFQENLTSLATVNALIGPGNSTAVLQPIVQPINDTIRRDSPGAKLSSLALTIKSTNNTGMWSLVEDYSLTVTGANSNSGSNVQSSLGFLGLNVSEPLQYAGMELNNIGPAIVLPALQNKVAAFPKLVYYIDGSHTANSLIPEQTTKEFSLLDFTWVPNVAFWNQTRDLLHQTTSWTWDPADPRYNLTLGLPSPEGLLINTWIGIYNPSFRVTVPASAWVSGNTVSFDTSTPAETIMPIIATSALIVAIGAVIFDWRLGRTQRARKRR